MGERERSQDFKIFVHMYACFKICLISNLYMHMHMHTHTCIHTQSYVHIQSYIHTYMFSLNRISVIPHSSCANTHTYIHTYIYIHIFSQQKLRHSAFVVRKYTYIHTYIHIHTYFLSTETASFRIRRAALCRLR